MKRIKVRGLPLRIKTKNSRNIKRLIYESLNPEKMWKFITGNIKEFWRGTAAGSFAGGSYVWFNKIILLDYVGSLFTIAFSAAVGGMLTALGADYYKHKLKHKIFKPKKDVDTEKDKDKDNEQVA